MPAGKLDTSGQSMIEL